MGVGIFLSPAIHERGLDAIPIAGALGILEQSGAEVVLPLFGRHHGEVPRHCGGTGLLVVHGGSDQRVVGFDAGEGLERGGEAHLLRQRFFALIRGDDPLQEVGGRFLIGLGCFRLNAPVILGTGCQTLVLRALGADVDWHHTNGIDLHARGDEVMAMMAGVVVKVGQDKSSGKYVTLRHGDYTVSYCHLSRVLTRKGAAIRPRDVVGITGSTGRSTGEHLHISCKLEGKSIDPSVILDYIRSIREECVAALTEL